MTLGIGGNTEVVYAQEPVEIEHKVILVEAESEEQKIIRRIKETFHEDPENAVAIARCESQFRKDVVSPTNDHGIMQINLTVHKEQVDALGLDVYNVEDNLTFARKLYDERGWKPWVCARKLGII